MQDCLQVVSLPRILAVKQLQELDGGKEYGHMREKKEGKVTEKQRNREDSREKKVQWQNEEEYERKDKNSFSDLKTDSATHL